MNIHVYTLFCAFDPFVSGHKLVLYVTQITDDYDGGNSNVMGGRK